ncbi:MAG: hypothetical protein ACC641_11520 [Acidiferrobacterales bacterium]
MKNIAILFLLLFSYPSNGDNISGSNEDWAGWASGDKRPFENAEFRKAEKGFGSMLVLENDPDFFKKWNVASATFRYKMLRKVNKGEYFVVAIIFVNPGVDGAGNTNITYDVKITKPDGTIYTRIPNLVVWNRKPPKRNTLGLSEGFLKIKMAPEDLAGNYEVEAIVNDKLKNVKLELSSRYKVEER